MPNFSFLVQFYWITPLCSKYFVWDCALFLGIYGKCYFQKAVFVKLSRHVSIIFRLNFKTVFWWYMISLYLLPLQILLSTIFSQETTNMICTFGGWPQNYFTKYAPLFQACCSVFLRNLLKDLLDRAGKISVVLLFDICNVYEIVAYDWLYPQYWCWVKMVDMAS